MGYSMWTPEEKEAVRKWATENPQGTPNQMMGEIGYLLGEKPKAGISSMLWRAKNPKVKVVRKVQEVVPPTSIVEAILERAEALEKEANLLRELAKDVDLIERWAKDTITLRTRMLVQVEGNGIVAKVEKEEI